MNRLALLIVCWLIIPGSDQRAWAGEDVDQTVAAAPDGIVRIHNPRGELQIYGWDRSEVKVEGDLDDLAQKVRFEVDGNRTLIHVALPTKNVNWGDGSDLAIYVPQASQLKVDGISTDIEVEGVSGAIAISTVSGDVNISGGGSQTQIKTVSGDVEVIDATGSLSVVTTSGDLEVEVLAEDVFVDTMSGDVELRLGAFNKLRVGSVSGSLDLAGRLNKAGSIRAKTVNADIELELTAPVNAKIHARTITGGKISNDLTDDNPEQLISRQMVLEAVAGDGSAEIVLNSVNGTIEIE